MQNQKVTQLDIAKNIGVSLKSINSKLNNRTPINVIEAIKIVKMLKIENPGEIFFRCCNPNTQQNKEGEY